MRTETSSFEITLGDKKFEAPYEKKVYETLEDILKEAQEGKDKTLTILKRINMAEDWQRRTDARAEYLKDGDAAQLKSFEDQVKAYIKAREKAGKPITESAARAKVKAMMED
jgi:hypothetical protein